MSNKCTWENFNTTNSRDLTNAFEEMTRVYFKLRFANNIDIELISKNEIHPGFEADPILIGDKWYAFQSKYCSNSPYKQFIESLKVAEKIYKGKIDFIILFCNRGFDTSCESYKTMLTLSNSIGATLKPICNNDILDSIAYEDKYKCLRINFFNSYEIDDKWFADKAKAMLDLKSDKYNRNNSFHIDTVSSNLIIDNAFENDYTVLLKERCDSLVESYRTIVNISNNHNFAKGINKKLSLLFSTYINDKITDKEIETIPGKFASLYKEVNKEIDKIEKAIAEKEEIKHNDEIQKYTDYLFQVSNLLFKVNNLYDNKIRYSIAKAHIIEGEFGCGKTHLLKYITDKRLKENKRTILLYGDFFDYHDSNIEEQILKSLNKTDIQFDDFLEVLEYKGERDCKYTYIIIDSINESGQYTRWKNNLGDLILKVNSHKYIKIFISLRSSYSTYCLGDDLRTYLSENKLAIHKLRGLSSSNGEIDSFLKHHGISYAGIDRGTIAIFTKPLLLSFYCKTNKGKDVGYISNIDRISLLNNYINYEENRWKESPYNINYPLQFNKVIITIGNYIVKKYKRTMPYDLLISELTKDGVNASNIELLEKSDIIETKNNDKGCKEVSFFYEAFMDKACSDALFDEEIDAFKNNIINFIGDGQKFRVVQSAIGLLLGKCKSVFNDDMNDVIDCLQKNLDSVTFNALFEEYIEALFEYKDYDVTSIFTHHSNYLIVPSICSAIFHCIISHTENNHVYELLDKLLFPLTLPQRDYIWTIYINDCYEKLDLDFRDYLSTLFNRNYETINEKELAIPVWLLTSSNRMLRDNISKTITKIFIINPSMMPFCLDKYLGVNDPYIVSRLLAATYGALVHIQNLDLNTYISIASSVYKYVFDLPVVYEDIQVRDYAKNIIELMEYRKIDLPFDVKKCYPPYGSSNVNEIKLSDVEKLYPKSDDPGNNFYGTRYIAMSMSPELKLGTFSFPYGDFGRYVFDSRLNNFVMNDLVNERKKIFLYAFSYIVENLGYDNELFSRYDKEHYSYRSRTNSTERIGKKYEWISMYHTLSKVADNYKVKSITDYDSKIDYNGTWHPFLRDYDPTQLLESSEREYNSPINFYIKSFNNFRLGDNFWVDEHVNDLAFEESLCIKDSNNDEWLAISTIKKDESGEISDNYPYQSMWFSMKAYIIDKSVLGKLKRYYSNHSCTNYITYEDSNYQLFAYDYCWSSSYHGYYDDKNVVNVTKSYRVEVKSNEDYKKQHKNIIKIGDYVISLPSKEDYHYEWKDKLILKMTNLSHLYLWESEYDYSKKDTIRYYVPSKPLVDILDVFQVMSGMWIDKDKKVQMIELSLLNNSNVDGLYVRKDTIIKKNKTRPDDNLAGSW